MYFCRSICLLNIVAMVHNGSKKSLVGLVLFLLFLRFPTYLFAQDMLQEEKRPQTFKEKIFYGGSLGLQFGNLTLVDLSPMIGYKLTSRVGIGISPTYKYYKYKGYDYLGNSYSQQSHVLGAGLFGRVLIFDNIFAHAEYEYLTYRSKDMNGSGLPNVTEYTSVLVGAGYREQIASNAYMYLLLLWNLNETIDSPYTNPVIRAGFSVGF